MALSEPELLACYRRLEKPLFNVLYRLLWDAHECEDLMHDAFLRIWKRRARIELDSLDALVYSTALNLGRNKLRWRRLWRFGALDPQLPGSDDPDERAADFQIARRVRAALGELPEAARHVLLLSEFAGMDTRMIAQVLDIPPGTVGSRKHHALAALRRQLQEDPRD